MTQEAAPGQARKPWWRTTEAKVWGAIVLAVLVVVVWAVVQQQRERAMQVDRLYCTLSGVSPLDRAPETGRTCADLMTN